MEKLHGDLASQDCSLNIMLCYAAKIIELLWQISKRRNIFLGEWNDIWEHLSGAPNENIVQNHLNILLLKVF